jgi:hypothetical protein
MTQLTKLSNSYIIFLQAIRGIASGEGAYTHDALNGQFFLSRLNDWEPTFRKTMADVFAFQGASYHKLFWVQEIIRFAGTAGHSSLIASETKTSCQGYYADVTAEKTAKHYYRIALDLDPDCARGLFNLGSLIAERSPNLEALELIDRASTLQPHYAPYADFKGAQLLELLGDNINAAIRWRRLAASGVLLGQQHHLLVLGLRKASDAEGVLREIDRCLDCSHFYAPEFIEWETKLPELINPSSSSSPNSRSNNFLNSIINLWNFSWFAHQFLELSLVRYFVSKIDNKLKHK